MPCEACCAKAVQTSSPEGKCERHLGKMLGRVAAATGQHLPAERSEADTDLCRVQRVARICMDTSVVNNAFAQPAAGIAAMMPPQ